MRTLFAHPSDEHVLIEPTRDGDDFIRVCDRHQWASVPTPGLAPSCPHCVADVDGARGKQRYAELHSANVEIKQQVSFELAVH